jgi:phosphate transport system protein
MLWDQVGAIELRMRPFFDQLRILEERLVEMAGTVRLSIQKSIRCLTERNEDYAEQVIRAENLVNQLEIQIDDLAVKLITLNQPVATDVRLLIAALKINTDLERMGDLAVNVAQRALTVIQAPPLEPDIPIPKMAARVEAMVETSISAFIRRDPDEARRVLLADDEIDGLRNVMYEELARRMEVDGGAVRRALGAMSIARNLERIADHATNIAEDVFFLARGIDVRHQKEPK